MKFAFPPASKKEVIAKKTLEAILKNNVFGKALGSGNAKNTKNKNPPVIREAKTSPWNKKEEKQYTRVSYNSINKTGIV